MKRKHTALFERLHDKRRCISAFMAVLLSVIIFSDVAWQLRSIGYASTEEVFCGLEEHIHTSECEELTLICGFEQEHTHCVESDCFDENRILTCTQSEHTHCDEDGCFGEVKVLKCDKAHKHSEENGCYEITKELVCEEEHDHSGECYSEKKVLVCDKSEDHEHTDECYDTEIGVVCDKKEHTHNEKCYAVEYVSDCDITEHTHTDACYSMRYVCGFEQEHTHSLACYSDTKADVESPSDWDKMFSNIELAGIYTEDVITIAKTQIGYTESKNNYIVINDEAGKEVKKGYTRYGAWYGDAYGDWSAMFISFCLNYAKVPEESFPRESSCEKWIDILSDAGAGFNFFAQPGSYIPSVGDLVFFDTDEDKTADSVALLSAVKFNEDGEVTEFEVIGKDEDNKVSVSKYDADDKMIIGYGTLSFFDLPSTSVGEEDINFAGEVVSHPALSYNEDRTSNRAYIEYANPGTDAGTTNGIPRRTIIYVYAQAGETICLGSDIYASRLDENDKLQSEATGADIVMIEPNGVIHTFDNDNETGIGYIGTAAKEQYGANFTGSGNTNGYTPHEYTVRTTGVYEIHFHSYSGARNIRDATLAHMVDYKDPTTVACNSNSWKNNGCTIGAYDVTVVKNGKVQTGRSYAKYVSFNIGSNSSASKTVVFHANNYVVTNDGYIYHVDANIDPYGFIFFCNNRGIVDDTTGYSAYRSYRTTLKSDLAVSISELGATIYNPSNMDSSTDKTFLVFFEKPSADLAGVLYTRAFAPEHITNIEFVGAKESNVTYVGNGGYFKFNVSNASSVSLTIDFSDYNDANHLVGDDRFQTVTINANVSKGTNYVYWDGTDSAGKTLPAAYYNSDYICVNVQTHAGEFHFTFIDVEGSNDITIERINNIYEYRNGVLVNVTEDYEDSKYLIYYNNIDNGKNNMEKNSTIADNKDRSNGIDSSGEKTLVYTKTTGDNTYLDIWTYAVNIATTRIDTDIVIEQLHGYDPVTLSGQVFFDKDKDTVYNTENGDFPLADVEVALDYYYCGTRWGIIREDDDLSKPITKLIPTAESHLEWTTEDAQGNPMDAVKVIDYYYHHYEVRLGDDGKYYLYTYNPADYKHNGSALPALDLNGDPISVEIDPFTDSEGHTDYRVWIPVHKTTTTDNMGSYIFSGVLVNQSVHSSEDAYYNEMYVTVVNPDSKLYHITTQNAESGDFNTCGSDVQTILLTELEKKVIADRNSGVENEDENGNIYYRYDVADVGYWYRLYEPPLTIQKLWGTEDLSDDVASITVIVQGVGVDDGQVYYTGEVIVNGQDGWSCLMTDIPAVVTMEDDVTGEVTEQPLTYRILSESFEKDHKIYTLIRDYDTGKNKYYVMETDANGNPLYDNHGNIRRRELGDDEHPFESFIDDLENLNTGDYITVENWVAKSATLELTKKSNADGSVLSHATFLLSKLNEATGKYEEVRYGFGTVYMLTTDDNGKLSFHGLTEGTYRLDEVVAPDTYRKVDPIRFTVTKDENGKSILEESIAEDGMTVLDELDQPLASDLIKYDQYLGTVTDAEFAIYPADSNYNYVPSTPALTLKVGEDGRAVFMHENADGTKRQMYISELKEILGSDRFVLVETHVPEGYRAVGEAHMRIIGTGMSTYVECENPFKSGVWTTSKVMAYANPSVHIADPNDYDKLTSSKYVDSDGVIQYYTYSNNGTVSGSGTLFGVILKRCGAEPDLTDIANITGEGWVPTYGDDINGYKVMKGYPSTLSAVVAAAHESGVVEFKPNSSGTLMVLEGTNMPGDSREYYTYMFNNNIPPSALEPQYLVAYYYSTADSLAGVTEANTVRVTSHGLDDRATPFTLYWGTTLEVPDVINSLYVQKSDKFNNLIENAVFALYDACADSAGNGYYIGTDSDANTVYIRLSEDESMTAKVYEGTPDGIMTEIFSDASYSVNTTGFANYLKTTTEEKLTQNKGLITLADAGVIKVTAGGKVYTIKPTLDALSRSCVSITHNKCIVVEEDGTGHFRFLKKGKYYLKEIYAPVGYDINDASVEVVVNDSGVYANSGTVDDGVMVGNGAGYLVSPLNVFASIGEIDETLSFIYGALKVSQTTADFIDLSVSNINSWPNMKLDENDTGKYLFKGDETTYSLANAAKVYLKYAGSANIQHIAVDAMPLFDYAIDTDENGDISVLRLWTESGWSDMAIYQNGAYEQILKASGATTKYSALGDLELSPIYSESTFVRVIDRSSAQLTVKKTDKNDRPLAGAQFVMYFLDENDAPRYYNKTTELWEAAASLSDSDYILTSDFNGFVVKNIPVESNLTLFIKEIKAPTGHEMLPGEIEVTVYKGILSADAAEARYGATVIVPETANSDGAWVYILTVPNDAYFVLPATGAENSIDFTLFGVQAVLLAAFGAVVCYRRRKSTLNHN